MGPEREAEREIEEKEQNCHTYLLVGVRSLKGDRPLCRNESEEGRHYINKYILKNFIGINFDLYRVGSKNDF